MRALAVSTAVTLLGTACGPSPATGDCTDDLLPGDLVITEVFADSKAPPGGSGTDEGKEWFEIYNASDRPVVLEGMTIVHARPDDSRAKAHIMKQVTVAPGQFFTLGNSATDLLSAYIDYGYSADLGDLFNTDGGKLTLSCGSSEIDSATYEGIKEGYSRQLTGAQPPDYTLNDDQLNWCQAGGAEFETDNFGTPGSDNDCMPVVVGQCSDGGVMRDAVLPVPGDLVITEVLPNPAAVADTAGEWFEVQVINAVDLNGVGLDRAGDTSSPSVIASADCIHVTPGMHVVFAKNADMVANGGLPAGSVLGTFGFALIDGTVAAPADVRVLVGTTVIDAITWTSSRSGKSHQLHPDLVDPIGNDSESNFCDGTTTYGGGDFGTPGAANAECATQPTPGMCDPGTGTARAIIKPAAGALVITEFLANPAGTVTGVDAAQEWFEIKNTGTTAFDLNGLGLKGSASTINLITAGTCKSVAPAGYALFAHGTDPAANGGLPAVDATFSFALGQTAGTLQVLDGMTPLDTVIWASAWSVLDGASKQLMPGMATTTATANDLSTNYCNGKTPQAYGSAANFGTPKALNVCLP